MARVLIGLLLQRRVKVHIAFRKMGASVVSILSLNSSVLFLNSVLCWIVSDNVFCLR